MLPGEPGSDVKIIKKHRPVSANFAFVLPPANHIYMKNRVSS